MAGKSFYESLLKESAENRDHTLSIYPDHLLSISEKLCIRLGLDFTEKEELRTIDKSFVQLLIQEFNSKKTVLL